MPTGFPSLLQSFFTDRLFRQRRASPHTIAGYRDSFRLLFQFAKERLGKAPSELTLEDLNVSFIGNFLDDLETRRKNSARTRNIRLAAIHSFFQYVAFEEPAHALLCQRILAMPAKRHARRPVEFLNREEIDALLADTDSSSWIGRRDRTMLLLAVQTGLRVSELIGLTCQDIVLEPEPMCIAKEKAENIGAHLSGLKRQRSWMPGCETAVAVLKIRCFSVPVVESSAVMRLSVSSPNTPRSPRGSVHLSNGRKSVHTYCDTRRPWTYSRMESTAP
jgi:integrase